MAKPRAAYVISAADPKGFPPESLPEIAVVGRSNVGKSSLINAMTANPGLARTSRTPGRTRLLNWFRVDTGGLAMHLVDLPGYGYAAVNREMRASWQPLIEAYLSKRAVLRGVLLLIDIRRGPDAEELDFVPWLVAHDIPVLVALTKADKLAKNQRQPIMMAAKRALGLKREPFVVSVDGDGLAGLWQAVCKAAQIPRAEA